MVKQLKGELMAIEHFDALQNMHNASTLNQKIRKIHAHLKTFVPFIDRIAFAVFDPPTGILRTFLNSEENSPALVHYQAQLDDAPSLKEIVKTRKPRIVEDLSIFKRGAHEHTKKINRQGYRMSYTLPLFLEDTLYGFLFFNSRKRHPFSESQLNILDLFAHLIFNLILQEFQRIQILVAAMRTITQIVHYKDPETGNHLERMAHFARIIAMELAKSGKYAIDDEYIQFVFAFAPLHDVGKIGIPDQILKKPARLEPEEFLTMQTHTTKGREIIDMVIRNFNFGKLPHAQMMRHIPEMHHETLDGSGYPYGLKNGQIPLEAQIIAVADIFDALTSKRPYKRAWSNEQALNYLKGLSTIKLNPDMVHALEKRIDEVIAIQRKFQDADVDAPLMGNH